jgi:hypothetical protein
MTPLCLRVEMHRIILRGVRKLLEHDDTEFATPPEIADRRDGIKAAWSIEEREARWWAAHSTRVVPDITERRRRNLEAVRRCRARQLCKASTPGEFAEPRTPYEFPVVSARALMLT